MNKEQILELAKAESAKVVDYDLLGNPITDADVLLMNAYGPLVIRIADAAIQHYKDSVLKEVGEPFGYMMPHYAEIPPIFRRHPLPKGHSPLFASETLYTSDQVAAAIAKATKPLEDQLAKAEQRVAEACALQVATETRFHWLDAARVAKEISSGEWRKFVKEV